MRRVAGDAKRGAAGGGDTPLTSPVDIIRRAAATVPENRDPVSPKNRLAGTAPAAGPLAGPLAGADEDEARPRAALRRAEPRSRFAFVRTLRRHRRPLAAAAAVAAAAALPVVLWKTGIFAGIGRDVGATVGSIEREARQRLHLPFRNLVIEGNRRTSGEAIRAALGLGPNDGLFAADPWALRGRIERLPWIGRAEVERRLPGTIIVRVVERKAIARFREGEATVLVDEIGALIPIAAEREHQALVLVSGPGAAESAPALLRLLAEEPTLAPRVAAAVRFGNRRWDLIFDDGSVVRLPEGALERAAWRRFGALERQYALLGRAAATYDMRLPDRLVVKGPVVPPTPAAGAPAGPVKPAPAPRPPRTG
jgi:cell division protein FtsQ